MKSIRNELIIKIECEKNKIYDSFTKVTSSDIRINTIKLLAVPLKIQLADNLLYIV